MRCGCSKLAATAPLGILLLTVTDARAQNPIIQEGSGDPSVKVFDGRAYVYGSHDFSPSNTTWIMKDWKVFSSADLVTWTDHGVALDDDSLPWRGVTDRDFAPDAIFYNGLYYFYFSLGDGTIGVAAGASPTGPFTDILGKPLINKSTTPIGNIDPMAFQDVDGSRYLIWGEDGCYIAELNDDMKSFKGSPQKVTISGAPRYREGPFAWMYGGTYYLLYSRCGSLCSDTLDYAVASSIKGPYTYKGTIIGHCKMGNEHGSVFQLNGQWYVAYHDLYPTQYYRKTKLEFIHYTNDGEIPRVYPTDYGVGRYDGTKRIEAENFFDKSVGIRYEDCTDEGNGFDIADIGNSSWLKYQNVDFGVGADSFQARVSPGSGASSIEIRLGGIDGALVGTCDVAAGDGTWTTVGTGLRGTVTGISDVFLVFNGETDNLLRLNWVRFTSSTDGGSGSDGSDEVEAAPACKVPPEAAGCSCGLGRNLGLARGGLPLCILAALGLLQRPRIRSRRIRSVAARGPAPGAGSSPRPEAVPPSRKLVAKSPFQTPG